MSDRISIPALRRWAERDDTAVDRQMLALVEAVEAAQACVLVQEDEDGTKWVGPRIGEFGKLLRALERFDFGGREHDPVLEQEC